MARRRYVTTFSKYLDHDFAKKKRRNAFKVMSCLLINPHRNLTLAHSRHLAGPDQIVWASIIYDVSLETYAGPYLKFKCKASGHLFHKLATTGPTSWPAPLGSTSGYSLQQRKGVVTFDLIARESTKPPVFPSAPLPPRSATAAKTMTRHRANSSTLMIPLVNMDRHQPPSAAIRRPHRSRR